MEQANKVSRPERQTVLSDENYVGGFFARERHCCILRSCEGLAFENCRRGLPIYQYAFCMVVIQCHAYDRKKWKGAPARLGFDRSEFEMPAYLLELLADVDRVVVPIDIAPADPQNLTAAQAIQGQHQERRIERM
nr:hypothetical protein [Nocardia wallacei]